VTNIDIVILWITGLLWRMEEIQWETFHRVFMMCSHAINRNSEAALLYLMAKLMYIFTLDPLCFKGSVHKYMSFRKCLSFAIHGHWAIETYQGVNRVYISRKVEHIEMNTCGPYHTANLSSQYEIRLEKCQHLYHRELKISYVSIFTHIFESGVDFFLKYLYVCMCVCVCVCVYVCMYV
jgi:hypothetical protein